MLWYVDDSKVSYVDPKVVSEVLSGLEARFGELSIKRGKEHTFVGMDLTWNNDKTVTISMKEDISECISFFGIRFNGGCTTPSKRNLFEVDEAAILLSKERSNIFHHVVAKLLFVSKRARPDIGLTISFLCGRVDKPNEQDWEKLTRLLHYLNETINETRKIGLNGSMCLKTWVDAAYGVHIEICEDTLAG